jgi:hypothetical protein
VPPPAKITTLEQLHRFLEAAIGIEHATLPPYLTALYSIRPGTNSDAYHIMRVVAVEEMLHLTLAANLLNAVGGNPNLTESDFVFEYPLTFPFGEDEFKVSLQRFSKECVNTFLKIEQPAKPRHGQSRLVKRSATGAQVLAAAPDDPGRRYYSIGEFYAEIERGFQYLHDTMDGKLFPSDQNRQARQVTKEYFYSGGGEIVTVTDLDSAKKAIRIITEQGEGYGEGRIYNKEGELAHYYRFQQLKKGQYYLAGDKADNPTGPKFKVDWDASYPIKKDAHLADYPADSELHAAAIAFNRAYADFLAFLTKAFNGEPALLTEAVTGMFRLRDLMTQLIHNPIPGNNKGENAAPTFEMHAVAAVSP